MITRKVYGFLAAVLILAALLVQPLAAQDIVKDLKFPKPNKLEIPDIEKITLDNGIRLYLLEDKSLPLFRASVRINCGTYLEPADKVGLASIFGMVMRTGGTEKWTGDEIDELLESIGGVVETGTDLTSGNATVNVLSDYTDLGLEVLAEVLRRPVFDQDKIDLALMQMRTDISRRNDDIATLARREYIKLIYGAESPYARHTEYATLDAISRDDVVAFHRDYIQPANIQMAIWGDFDKEELMAMLNKYFGDWQPNDVVVPPLPEVDYKWRSKVYYAEKTDVEQAYIRIGHLGGLMTDPDYTDKLVMSTIVGGSFGSRITDNVRTRLGLAYSTAGRYISNIAYPGYFFAYASTSPGNTVLAAREMLTQIKSMQTDLPTAEEMAKGKDGYLNSFVFNFDSRGEVINRMMTYDFYGLPEDFLQQEKEGVEKVTAEAVMEAAKTSLRPDQMIVLIVGNAAEFDMPLDSLGLGAPELIDISIPSGEVKREIAVTPENLARGMEIVTLAVGVHGGLDNIKAVKNTHMKGTYTLSTPQGDFPLGVDEIQVLPDKSRTVINMMGQEMLDVTDGETGWRQDPRSGLVDKSPEELADEKKDRDRNTLWIFQHADDPYYQAVYDGNGTSNDVAADFVVLLDEAGEQICRLAFDAASHQLIGKSFWGNTPMGEGNIDEYYADYKEINGVTIAMASTRFMSGQKIAVMSQTEFTINGEIPADSFARPE